LKDLLVVVLVLPLCPSPGTDRPATGIATSGAFHPALTAKTPGLHRSSSYAILVGCGPVVGVHRYRFSGDGLAGHFTVRFP
jgi:hypothetical protein